MLKLVVDYVKQRMAFNVPLATFQYIQFRLAELATKIEAARTLVYRVAAVQVEQGKLTTCYRQWLNGIEKSLSKPAIRLCSSMADMVTSMNIPSTSSTEMRR